MLGTITLTGKKSFCLFHLNNSKSQKKGVFGNCRTCFKIKFQKIKWLFRGCEEDVWVVAAEMNECSSRHCCPEGVVRKHCGFSRRGWLISLSDGHPAATASFTASGIKKHICLLLLNVIFHEPWRLDDGGCSSLFFVNSHRICGSCSSKTASWRHRFSKTAFVSGEFAASRLSLGQTQPLMCTSTTAAKLGVGGVGVGGWGEFLSDSWQAEMYTESFLAICCFFFFFFRNPAF